MPTNLYGPGDNYHPDNSHVVPALIRRFHEAKENGLDKVLIWGTGAPKREFLYVDDMAEACLFVHNLDHSVVCRVTRPMLSHINVGVEDLSIKELAEKIKNIVGFKGELVFDGSKPDGTMRKLMNTNLLSSLGGMLVPLETGLNLAYQDFLRNSLCEPAASKKIFMTGGAVYRCAHLS